jgi:carbon monoxide dehydrogenase subunit G
MPMAEQTEGSIEVAATPAEVMAVISDYPAYPSWAQGVKKTEVRATDAQGRPIEVRFEVGQMGIGAEYTLDYTYKGDDGGVSWTSKDASGAVKAIEGEYVLEPSGDATTVTYRTSMELAIALPGIMKRQAEKMIINTALGGLKKEVESRSP